MASHQIFNSVKCRSITYFAASRKEQYDFSLNQIKQVPFSTNVIVDAQVKCGKREIVIIDHKLDETAPGVWSISHYFFTALKRVDAKVQIEELEAYGIKCFYSDKHEELHTAVLAETSTGRKVKIHVDESDLGSGVRQCMNNAFRRLKNNPNVQFVFHSASNEELFFSSFGKTCKKLTFVPSKAYCGAEYYLANNNVHEPDRLWDENRKTFTQHGIDVFNKFQQGNKPIAIMRISSKMGELKRAKDFETLIRSRYGFEVRFVDASHSFDWGETDDFSNEWEKAVTKFEKRDPTHRLLIVICQTATRSTEIKFHQYISFWHEGKRNTNYSTAIQAAGRVFFYNNPVNNPPNNPVNIQLYANKRVLELAAKRITYEEYNGKLSGRMKVINEDGTRIEIKQKLVIFDHKPTIEECRAAAIKLGAYSNFKSMFNRNVSTTGSQDNARMCLSGYLIGNGAGDKREAMTMHFDGPSPDPVYAKTWKDVKFMGYDGKYAFIAEFLHTIAAGTEHVTTTSSMYS